MQTPGWFTTVLGSSVVIMMQTAVLTVVVLVMTGQNRGAPEGVLNMHEEYKIEEIG